MKLLVISTAIVAFCFPAISQSATSVEPCGFSFRTDNITEGTRCQTFAASGYHSEKRPQQAHGYPRIKQPQSVSFRRTSPLMGKYSYQEAPTDNTQRYPRPIAYRLSESMRFFAHIPPSSSTRGKVRFQFSDRPAKYEADITRRFVDPETMAYLSSKVLMAMSLPIYENRAPLTPHMSDTQWGANGKIRKVARRLTPDIFARFE